MSRSASNGRTPGRLSAAFLLGLDLFDDVLPKFRPNWGFYLVPREPLDKEAVPVEALLAIQLPPVPADNNPITDPQGARERAQHGLQFAGRDAKLENARRW